MYKQLRQRIGLLACVVGATAFAACGGGGGGSDGGNGNTSSSSGNSSGTTSGNTSGGSGDGGTTSGGSSGTTSGGSSGTTSGGSSTSSGSSGTAKTYCDGVQFETDGGAQFMIETFNFSGSLKDCSTTAWNDGKSVQNVGGILDTDILDTGEGAGVNAPAVLFVGGCDDLQAAAAADGGTAFPAPDAGSPTTVAAAVAAQSTGTFWGVVTAAYSGGAGKSESFYVEDVVAPGGTPAPKSGIGIYVGKNYSTAITAPNRGDVVVLTDFKWSPYNGKNSSFAGFNNNQNQFEAQASSTVTVIGQTTLPPPVVLSPSDVNWETPSATAEQAFGMRVTVSGGPFTVAGSGPSNTCPAPLKKTVTSSGSGG